MADVPQKKILVIDDTRAVQQFAENFLKRLKIGVYLASDGYEGLQIALSSKPDLILLDLMMPRLDGFKTLQVIKSNQITKEIPVIVMTAYSDRINVVSAGKLGATAVITKPLTEEIILQKLRQVFGEPFVKSIIPKDTKAMENPFGVKEEEYNDVVRGMVEEFIKYFAQQVDELEYAVRSEDVGTIERITHNIRGTGGSFGYDDATTLATHLSQTVHASPINWGEANDLLVQLKNRLKR